ncbi:hypothetical protein V0U79_05190 [Hyphobacterium sp. HN65]|uniref:Uncharacterized protein n=1 Tax=Hyphobacterium lacteum TaxID=3116575 RepID=A0ABU7LPB0_9PROT|nr:hypothetical protein [Hyphobacterium sp. HN65]MEE2525753.1 hypothetical protein [Hyphobacterium sp. HN65]
MTPLDTLEQQVTGWAPTEGGAETDADWLLAQAECVIENWLLAHDKMPTDKDKEGFRLLGLHRQAAKGDPSFNACRETCRELAYRYNLVKLEPGSAENQQRLEMMKYLVHHLVLFISGKLQEAGLGDFCCSSRPLRQAAH